jgi:hypothetical protein
MTANVFERLLYTDCRVGMGRGAGGGFQIQAQSAGVDSAQSRMAVGWLLYEAQNAWIMQRRPVEEFPLGFAHACDAGYGTAQSRYVGKESTGGRQGNHLADCLLTRDPDQYGPIRPAQLWRSALWRAEPWETTDCPPFDGQPPLGPLTVEAVTGWLRGRPERAPVLAALVSVLEDSAGKRVVIVSASPDEALSWIAAATLLLPVRLALDVSFKVFGSNPFRAQQRVVAVPKELSTQLGPGRPESVLILDAEECVIDDATISGRARFLVEQLTGVDDPYDVIDAVELAESLGGVSGAEGLDAMLTAWAVTRPADPPPDPVALSRWLYRARPHLQRDFGPAVASMILGAAPPAGMLRWLDDAASRAAIDLDRAQVRRHLFAVELAEARDGQAVPADVLAEVVLEFDARRDAESELSSAILLGSDAQVDLLLRLGRRHGIQPDLAAPPLLRRLEAFVGDWIDHGYDYDPNRWALHDEILDLTQEALRARLASYGIPGVRAVLKRLFRYFADRVSDPADPLERHLKAAAIAALPSRERPAQVQALLRLLLRSPQAATAAVDLQQALLEWGAVGPREAVLILTELPGHIQVLPEIGAVVSDALGRVTAKPDEDMLEVLACLDRRAMAPSAGPLAVLLAADRDVMAFIQAASTDKFVTEARYFRSMVARLGRADPAVVRVRLRSVLRACLDCPHPRVGGAVLSALSDGQARAKQGRALVDLWAGELYQADHYRAVAWGVSCLEEPGVPGRRRDQIAAAIRKYRDDLTTAECEKWVVQVQGQLLPEQLDTWAGLVGHEMHKPRINLWKTRDGGRS